MKLSVTQITPRIIKVNHADKVKVGDRVVRMGDLFPAETIPSQANDEMVERIMRALEGVTSRAVTKG